MIDRYVALQALVEFSRTISELQSLFGSLAWDFDGSPLVMNRGHFRSVLERYLKGGLSSQEIEDWANLVEGREDITFEPDDAELLREVVYELANPELTEQLSNQRAMEMVGLLGKD
jgi:hypothetical protein